MLPCTEVILALVSHKHRDGIHLIPDEDAQTFSFQSEEETHTVSQACATQVVRTLRNMGYQVSLLHDEDKLLAIPTQVVLWNPVLLLEEL